MLIVDEKVKDESQSDVAGELKKLDWQLSLAIAVPIILTQIYAFVLSSYLPLPDAWINAFADIFPAFGKDNPEVPQLSTIEHRSACVIAFVTGILGMLATVMFAYKGYRFRKNFAYVIGEAQLSKWHGDLMFAKPDSLFTKILMVILSPMMASTAIWFLLYQEALPTFIISGAFVMLSMPLIYIVRSIALRW